MKTDINSYIPFQHENYGIKRSIVSLAKTQPASFEGRHTSVLMYVNIVDYIAYHLIENLGIISKLVTYHELNGIICFKGDKSSTATLGNKIEILKKYEFPDKVDFLDDLGSFIKLRNKYVHGLMMMNDEDIKKIDGEFSELAQIAERLINKYDTIINGVTETWKSYLSKLSRSVNTVPNIPDPTPDNTQKDQPSKNEK